MLLPVCDDDSILNPSSSPLTLMRHEAGRQAVTSSSSRVQDGYITAEVPCGPAHTSVSISWSNVVLLSGCSDTWHVRVLCIDHRSYTCTQAHEHGHMQVPPCTHPAVVEIPSTTPLPELSERQASLSAPARG